MKTESETPMYSTRTVAVFALPWLLLGLFGAACAGANGDPAPAPVEAGAPTPVACEDAGSGG
jgi:hypothetical protein